MKQLLEIGTDGLWKYLGKVNRTIQWPQGKRFAFTIFDDTDAGTLANLVPIYDLLHSLGMRTTKSVWPLAPIRPGNHDGATCAEPDYLKWLLELQAEGFEIAFHMARSHSSVRADTILALDRFRELFGHDPYTMANHSANQENMYWGGARLSGVRRSMYQFAQVLKKNRQFTGEIEGDQYFWGDICRERVQYVRSFTYRRLNHLPIFPFLPYVDPSKPFVAAWFTGAHAPVRDSLVRLLGESAQDQLEAEGGLAIIYTHFAAGFVRDGEVDSEVRRLLTRLSQKPGWFVPVHSVLDYLTEYQGLHTITSSERVALEWRWLRDQLLV